MDVSAPREALRTALTMGRPLKEPEKLLRVAIGMTVAAVGGHFLHNFDAQVLVCVGAFLGGIGALIPHNRPRLTAAVGTGAAEVLAALAGVALHGRWIAILILLFVGLFAAGMLRAVAIGISMRTLVVTLIFLAFAEIAPSFAAGIQYVALFGVGVAVMLAAQLLPPNEPRYDVQRRSVAAFYKALGSGSGHGPALLAADRSLALVHRRSTDDTSLHTLIELVERGEEIGQLLQSLGNRAESSSDSFRGVVAQQLVEIAHAVERGSTRVTAVDIPSNDDTMLETALRSALMSAVDTVTGARSVRPASGANRPPSAIELVRDELHRGSPIVHHAARLAITGVVGELAGLAIGALVGPTVILRGHGFWVVVAVALILFPDYGDTFARGFARTLGTVLGAAFGIAFSFVPLDDIGRTAALLGLYFGYLAFRSCGQMMTMLWVVAWISSLSVGPLGAVTRGSEAVVGCVLALTVFVVFPTYRRERLDGLLSAWSNAEADRLDALAAMWEWDDDEHRRTVGHATVRSRLERIDFLDAAKSSRLEPVRGYERWSNQAIVIAGSAVEEIARQVAAISVLGRAGDKASVCAASQLADRLRPQGDGPEHPVEASAANEVVPDRDIAIAFQRANIAIDRLGQAFCPPSRESGIPEFQPNKIGHRWMRSPTRRFR